MTESVVYVGRSRWGPAKAHTYACEYVRFDMEPTPIAKALADGVPQCPACVPYTEWQTEQQIAKEKTVLSDHRQAAQAATNPDNEAVTHALLALVEETHRQAELVKLNTQALLLALGQSEPVDTADLQTQLDAL